MTVDFIKKSWTRVQVGKMFKCVTICNMTSIPANKYMLEKKA